jgi:hypothetical protein
LRGPLGPVIDLARPVLKTEILITVLFGLVLMLWLRAPSGVSSGQLGPYGAVRSSDRIAAYEEMWRREESELWAWLESRAGVDSVTYQSPGNAQGSAGHKDGSTTVRKQNQRQKALKSKDAAERLREEAMAEKEVQEAIRVTRERLEVLESVVKGKKGDPSQNK